MKALHLVRHGSSEKAFEIREAPMPSCKENEVLIHVEGFGLNFADVMARLGLYQDAPPLPAILGYDVVGKVKELGKNVTHLKVGDRVVALTRFGGYAEYAVAQGFACAKIADTTPIAEACALATQFCTAQYMIEKKMSVMPKDKLLVHAGAGGVGSALIQLGVRKKAHVIATVGSESKVTIARKLGALEVIDTSKEDFQKKILEHHGKHPLDAVFDSIGGKTYRQGMALLKPGGTFCAYGIAERAHGSAIIGIPVIGTILNSIFSGIRTLLSFRILLPPILMMKGQTFAGVNMLRVADEHPLQFQEILKEVVELYEAGEIKPLAGGEFSVAEIGKAHDLLENRKTTGKIAIRF